MKKRQFSMVVLLLLVGMLTACSKAQDPMEELLNDPYGDYREEGGEIAFVYDGVLADGNYNEAIYEGTRMYALAAGVSFSCYGTVDGSAEERRGVIERAASNKAQIIICAGHDFQEAVIELQTKYSEAFFLLIDGSLTDVDGNKIEIAEHVHCVSFKEEESGYLAGYTAVMEGYRNFGFMGEKKEPSVVRYGHGYLQGIQDAAKEMKVQNVTVNYCYSDSSLSARADEETALQWYETGTEVIFACGGALYEVVFKAAEETDGMLIGADVDQSRISERFLTSAVKDLTNGVIISLDDYYASGRKWPDELAGKQVRYGAEENCAGIPVWDTEWRFQKVTKEDFWKLYKRIRTGEIKVSDGMEGKPGVTIAVNYF
ncbi:MAG: BMP family ABC transporter substrate-binding protein [Lachnospiraceae bacterium]|nr:BMP family ABC transporter substrate-binding protein [Lachnospiraceae bacterium]